jgi:hypothetical protein
MVTRQQFINATGRAPLQDDMERCNCELAGEAGHMCCGWNRQKNGPVFEVGVELPHDPKDEAMYHVAWMVYYDRQAAEERWWAENSATHAKIAKGNSTFGNDKDKASSRRVARIYTIRAWKERDAMAAHEQLANHHQKLAGL